MLYSEYMPDETQPLAQVAPPTMNEQQPQPVPPVRAQDSTQTTAQKPVVFDGSQYGFEKPQPEEELIQWQAPSRPFKKHNRQFYTTTGMIVLLVGLILFFAGQTLPMAVIIAVVFYIYVQNSIVPGLVVYKLTTYGIRVADDLYYWEELGRFWFTEQYGKPVLRIEVTRFPFRLAILLGDLSKEDMTAILSEILLNEKPPLTTYEKMARWLHEKIPLDLDS